MSAGRNVHSTGVHALLLAALGYAAVELPGMLAGSSGFWLWGVLGATVVAITGLSNRQDRKAPHGDNSWLVCTAATIGGVCFDFLATPPEMLLSQCGGGLAALRADSVATQLWYYPATLVMSLVALAVPRLASWLTLHRSTKIWRSFAALLPVGVDVCAMLALMVLGMAMTQWAAQKAGLPWTADGMVTAMLGSMMVFFKAKASLAQRLTASNRATP
jgi:hypothetical protein